MKLPPRYGLTFFCTFVFGFLAGGCFQLGGLGWVLLGAADLTIASFFAITTYNLILRPERKP